METFSFSKSVDRSMLREGVNIPVKLHQNLYKALGKRLEHGQSVPIVIVIDNVAYDAELKNQNFDREKYHRRDVVQIRYRRKSPLSVRLREIFKVSDAYLEKVKNLPEYKSKKREIKLPTTVNEKLMLRSSQMSHVFMASYTTCDTSNSQEQQLMELKEKLAELEMRMKEMQQGMVINVSSATLNLESVRMLSTLLQQPKPEPTVSENHDEMRPVLREFAFKDVMQQDFVSACLVLEQQKYLYSGTEGFLMSEAKDWYYVGRIAMEVGFFGTNFQTRLATMLQEATFEKKDGTVLNFRCCPSKQILSYENRRFGQPLARLLDEDEKRRWALVPDAIDQEALNKSIHIAYKFLTILRTIVGK